MWEFCLFKFSKTCKNDDKFNQILKEVKKMNEKLDQILAVINEESTVADTLIGLIQGIKQQLADALAGTVVTPEVQAKIDAILSQATANKQKLSDAVIANTQ